MKVIMTEALAIELDSEKWHCRACDNELGSARESYKHGLLVYDRNPVEIHKPLLDPEKYQFTFSPDPQWIRILEYYCPHCGHMVEVEYTVPGHPPLHDMDVDVDWLKAYWQKNKPLSEPVLGPDTDFRQRMGHHHHD